MLRRAPALRHAGVVFIRKTATRARARHCRRVAGRRPHGPSLFRTRGLRSTRAEPLRHARGDRLLRSDQRTLSRPAGRRHAVRPLQAEAQRLPAGDLGAGLGRGGLVDRGEPGLAARAGLSVDHGAALSGRCTKRYDKVLERLGRLKERYRQVAGQYDIAVERGSGQGRAAQLATAIRIEPNGKHPARYDKAGMYVLRTSHTQWRPERVVQTYWQLAEIEAAFRSLKGEAGLRPIFHVKPGRQSRRTGPGYRPGAGPASHAHQPRGRCHAVTAYSD